MSLENKPNLRIFELDGLRGVAAFLVLLHHYVASYNRDYGHSKLIYLLDIIIKYPYLDTGVNLFFIISGFVIILSLDKTKRPLDFFVSRFSRLYPAYWFSLFLTSSTVYFFGVYGMNITLQQVVINMTMLQEFFSSNTFSTKINHVDPVYWTLTLELSFYFSAFVVYSFGFLDKIVNIVYVWIFLGFLLWFLNDSDYKFNNILMQILVYLLIFEAYAFIYFSLGILFYKKYVSGGKNNLNYNITIFLLLLSSYIMTEIPIFLSTCFYTVLFYMVIKGKASFLKRGIFLFLGKISYPLYLIHWSIGIILISTFYNMGLPGEITIILSTLIIVLTSYLINFFIEIPSQRIIRQKYREKYA